MSSLQAKERILIAADQLFQQKGYEQVTVREIAKQANCSHTSIYVYYKDKKELLGQLVSGPLLSLVHTVEEIAQKDIAADHKLKQIAVQFVTYGLENRHLYQTIMTLEAGRVDEPGSDWEISQLRMRLFQVLQQVVVKLIGGEDIQKALAFSRVLFFQLHGTVTSYSHTSESITTIKERVLPLVLSSVSYLISGVMQSEADTNFPAYL